MSDVRTPALKTEGNVKIESKLKPQFAVVLHSAGSGYVVRKWVDGRAWDQHNYKNAVPVKLYTSEYAAEKYAHKLTFGD